MDDLVSKFLKVKLTKFIPHTPTPKQTGFLLLPHDEVLFGGSLGGGKSDAALMAALQHVDVPGYSALVLRKRLSDLKLPGALLDRATNWLSPFIASKEVKYVASQHSFIFKTYDHLGKPAEPAVVQFGYIGDSNAYTRYQGIELNVTIYDELTQHAERDYEYLMTRLRKCVCPLHTETDANDNPIYDKNCPSCQRALSVPIRMLSTCNPDGIGFAWVKKRFRIEPNMTKDEADAKGVKVKWIGKHPERPFLPSSYKDNPYLDRKDYERRMKKQLSPDLYEALMEGSWGVIANARFKKRWQRFFSQKGNLIYFGPNYTGKVINFEKDIIQVFQTIDPASSSAEGPGDIELFPTRVKNPSHTVISTWALTTCYNLLWINMVRFRDEIPVVVDELRKAYKHWNPAIAIVESNGIGKGVAQYAESFGMRIKGIHKVNDKVENATSAILQMEHGKIWFPQSASWLNDAEEEVFTWQGHPQEPDDIVDTLAHAANHVDWERSPESLEYSFGGNATSEGVPMVIKRNFGGYR
jgi:predicted phage terminase large subunit-like protein